MAKEDGDTLMMFKRKGASTWIAGEGQSTINTDDGFTSDFKQGFFVEIEDFDLDIGLRDEDASADDDTGDKGKGKGKSKAGRSTPFSGFTQAPTMPTTANLATSFPIQMQEFGFSRRMEVSSPLLFMCCFTTQPFDEVVLVRRKTGGLQGNAFGSNSTGTDVAAFAYMRIEFKEVLLTSVGYDGGAGEEVKEKYKFVCRHVQTYYKQQHHHGKLKPAVTSGELDLVKST